MNNIIGTKQSFKVCFCFKRRFKFGVPDPPEDVKNMFNGYSKNGYMTMEDLVEFLREIQGEEDSKTDDAKAIFDSLKHLKIFHRTGIHLDAFFRYLLGDLNLVHTPRIHNDMTAPLSHYYLYTGHNSYLTGNQLSSDSSVTPIINALRHGVRVIELDLWPNSMKNRIQVRHGGTLTKPVGLKDCLRAIKDYAFFASEYPVVITFEDHLPPNLQAKVAKLVTKTFGDMLYFPKSDYLMEFPSPEMLKRKVMISTKPPEYRDSSHHRRQASKGEQNDAHSDKEKSERETSNQKQNTQDDSDNDDDDDDGYEDEDNDVIPEYKQLIAIHAGKPKGKINKWLADSVKVRRLSLSEQELENSMRTHATDIIRFTQKNFLRIYPKGTRFDSSNYNPMYGWMHGAQMVAFNMQGYGKHLWIMQGMFRANGGCGYVKKPDFLLDSDKVFNPQETLRVITTLKVKVLMGEGWHWDFRHTHFDRFSPPDFYTRVGIAGAPQDSVMKRTKTIEDQWIPVWNEEFDFPLTVPELALLRIEVLEYDTSGNADFGGQTCLPVWELRTGIRAVPLYKRKGDRYKSTRLLLHLQFV